MSCPRCCAAFLAVATLLGSSSCSDAPVMTSPAATPGTIIVSLAAAAPAGAVLVDVRGEGIGLPTAIDPGRSLFVRSTDDAGAYSVAVVGERVEGALFTFTVPDVKQLRRYTVTLREVADETNRLQANLAGYQLSIDASAQAAASDGSGQPGAADVTIHQ